MQFRLLIAEDILNTLSWDYLLTEIDTCKPNDLYLSLRIKCGKKYCTNRPKINIVKCFLQTVNQLFICFRVGDAAIVHYRHYVRGSEAVNVTHLLRRLCHRYLKSRTRLSPLETKVNNSQDLESGLAAQKWAWISINCMM